MVIFRFFQVISTTASEKLARKKYLISVDHPFL
jgi:hypothetical protein